MENNWNISVNGESLSAKPGQTILDIINSHQVELPQVCYHPSLGSIETCDTCIVGVNGELKRACSTLVENDMKITTTNSESKAARLEAMNRILHNHELYCTVCDNNNGDCVVHNTTKLLEIDEQKYPFEPKPYKKFDDTNPFYSYDVDQCILCGRCVEACQDLEVNETLSIDWSLERPRVIWDQNVPIGESSCVSCGHCVTVCPCNALMEKSMLGQAGYMTGIPDPILKPMIQLVQEVEPGFGPTFAISDAESAMRQTSRIKKTKTVCTYCGVGCSFEMWTKDDRHILQVAPTPEAPSNGISTCVKGKFGWNFVNNPERLKHPLIRKGDTFVEASWEEALALIATRLMEIKDAFGPDSIGFIASSKGTNEEAYLVQKLARAVIGTNNVDNDSTYCQDPATYGLRHTVGYGADSGSLADILEADLSIIVGSNTAESHPVWATRVKRAHKLFGQKLIVADLRRHEMAERADIFLQPNPGSDLVWLSGVAKYLVDQDWVAHDFIKERVHGYDEYVASLAPYTLEYVEATTGITADVIKDVAQTIHEAQRMVIMWAMGVTQQQSGSETSLAISNLLLLTGNYGRPGTGAYPLRGHNNVQGASDNGAKPAYLSGYQDLEDPEVQERFQKEWGVPLPKTRGLNNQEFADAILDKKVRAMYVVGEDVVVVDNNASHAQKAFEQLDFLVVEEVFLTHTAQYADVVLPASPSLEKDGTFTSTERRIQRLYQVFEPLGQSRPDWKILRDVANAMGAEWHYHHPAEIMDEIARVTPLFAGVSYERLEGFNSLQWPVQADGQDMPRLFEERFNFPDGKARFVPTEYIGPTSQKDPFNIHLNNGDLLEHFHEGNMTYKVAGIRYMVPEVFVEVSPELARERHIENGSLLRLTSPNGSIEVPAVITDRVKGHQIYVPLNNDYKRAVNILTGTRVDIHTDTPAYKDTSVTLEVLERVEKAPLPERNWRNQHRVPHIGVEVEHKWQRPDYEPLVTLTHERRESHGATHKSDN